MKKALLFSKHKVSDIRLLFVSQGQGLFAVKHPWKQGRATMYKGTHNMPHSLLKSEVKLSETVRDDYK